MILQISASQEVRITGLSHSTWLQSLLSLPKLLSVAVNYILNPDIKSSHLKKKEKSEVIFNIFYSFERNQ
jgi:hypothetical protein